MKRFITILVIILIVLAIILGGAWLFSRRTAEKNGTAKPTFRQFLSGDTNTGTGLTPNDGSLSSVFVDDNLSSATPGTSVTPTIGTQVAQFSSGAYTPTTSTGSGTGTSGTGTNGSSSGSTPGSGVPGETTAPGSTTTVDPTTQTPASVPPTVAGPECSSADLNIEFTPEQLIQLQALQNRFYALSQTLRTDADVATETGNHDNFKAKVDTITGLYNRCVARTAQIPANSQYKLRVPTPFWHVLAQDAQGFIGGVVANNGACSYLNPVCAAIGGGNPYDGFIGIDGPNASGSFLTPNNTAIGLRTLERSLRLNLW